MVGNVGSVKAIPKPSSTVVQTALNLMAAYGGGDRGLRKDLTEMRKVQENNERVLGEAKKAISEAETAEESARKEQVKAQGAWGEGTADLDKRTVALDAKQRALEAKTIKQAEERKSSLAEIAAAKAANETRAQVLAEQTGVVETEDIRLRMLANEIGAKEAELEAGEKAQAAFWAGIRKLIPSA